VRQAIAQQRVDEEAVIRLVDAAMKSPYPGSYYNSQAEFNCESSNIKNLVDSILKAYSNLGKAGEPAMFQP